MGVLNKAIPKSRQLFVGCAENGGPENGGPENAGPATLEWKMQDQIIMVTCFMIFCTKFI